MVFADPGEDEAEVDDGAGEPVEFGDDQDVALAVVEPVENVSEVGAPAHKLNR